MHANNLRTVAVTIHFEVEGDAEDCEILGCLGTDVEDALRWQSTHGDAGGLGLAERGDVINWTVFDPEMVA